MWSNQYFCLQNCYLPIFAFFVNLFSVVLFYEKPFEPF